MSPRDVAQADKHTDKVVLELLLEKRDPWSLDELGRELGDAVRAEDSVGRLSAAGLVNRADDLLFPSRAAVYAADLDLAVGGEDD
jgi:predicted transcriptional regulator